MYDDELVGKGLLYAYVNVVGGGRGGQGVNSSGYISSFSSFLFHFLHNPQYAVGGA
jgi:hypothetical protein